MRIAIRVPISRDVERAAVRANVTILVFNAAAFVRSDRGFQSSSGNDRYCRGAKRQVSRCNVQAASTKQLRGSIAEAKTREE